LAVANRQTIVNGVHVPRYMTLRRAFVLPSRCVNCTFDFMQNEGCFSHLNEGIGVNLVHCSKGSPLGHTRRTIARCTYVTDSPERKLLMTTYLLSFTLIPSSGIDQGVRS
jgi:hypothetical protein